MTLSPKIQTWETFQKKSQTFSYCQATVAFCRDWHSPNFVLKISWKQTKRYWKLTKNRNVILQRVELGFFLLDRSFLVLTQSHCSSPIATKDFGGAVSPLFCPVFAGSFHHLISPIKKICLLTLILFNIFLWKYGHALPLTVLRGRQGATAPGPTLLVARRGLHLRRKKTFFNFK